jgi:hypothetical protein
MHQGECVDKVELMKVEEAFMIESIGLVLAPSFTLPPEGKWKNIQERVTVETPDGNTIIADALFSIAHFNIKDPTVSASKSWPILVSLTGVAKENVPVGSTLYVSHSTKIAVTGQNA